MCLYLKGHWNIQAIFVYVSAPQNLVACRVCISPKRLSRITSCNCLAAWLSCLSHSKLPKNLTWQVICAWHLLCLLTCPTFPSLPAPGEQIGMVDSLAVRLAGSNANLIGQPSGSRLPCHLLGAGPVSLNRRWAVLECQSDPWHAGVRRGGSQLLTRYVSQCQNQEDLFTKYFHCCCGRLKPCCFISFEKHLSVSLHLMKWNIPSFEKNKKPNKQKKNNLLK